MEGAQDVGVLPGHSLRPGEQEAPAAVLVFVQSPAVRAVEGVLGHGDGQHSGQGDQDELHGAEESRERLREYSNHFQGHSQTYIFVLSLIKW